MKTLLTKLFPEHNTGDAACIVALLAIALLVLCLAANDGLVRGYPWNEVRATLGASILFAGLAGITYRFSAKKV